MSAKNSRGTPKNATYINKISSDQKIVEHMSKHLRLFSKNLDFPDPDLRTPILRFEPETLKLFDFNKPVVVTNYDQKSFQKVSCSRRLNIVNEILS